MKKLVFFFVLLSVAAVSQVRQPQLHDNLFSTYYHQRAEHFKMLPQTKGDIIFAGNSITDGAEWSELFDNIRIKNRGISGDVSAGLIHRIKEITARKPAKVFVLIGTNDLARNIVPDSLIKNILWIASYLKKETPYTKLYVQSILPVNKDFGTFGGHTSKAGQIKQVNDKLRQAAGANHFTYIDLHTPFSDEQGNLNSNFTNDGLHLKGEGYMLWKHLVYPYVFDLQNKPSILPLPQQLQWNAGYFPLYKTRTIVVKNAVLRKEAERLANELNHKGLFLTVSDKIGKNEPYIELKLGKVNATHFAEEAYQLEVSPQSVILTATAIHGVFNGVQTLLQLMRDNVLLDACSITDWPAFSWRAYMVDVGRNFQSIQMLKQQIDLMSKYKLNVFHFHPTEDIAWRLQIAKYPQLTAPEHMLRDKGAYYSIEEIKDLIQYCNDRHITFVPEIDMPGHSAAFERAMGVGMQSVKGKQIVKEILTEFCKTYDVPYLHIGGDEVKITDHNFLPEMITLIHQLGKKTIGWDPGGNLNKRTIRQLWMKEGAALKDHQYIDSRHLYLNHMDPLESVTTIFHREIGDRQTGDKNVLGGTLCLWHDRSVQNETDLFAMNPVYPAMLTFAERVWKGGGWDGWITNVEVKNGEKLKDFRDFEERLLDQDKIFFPGLPFPYVAQSDIKWKLLGPYENKGDVSKKFAPEQKMFKPDRETAEVVGGTIVLRHFWHPLVKGVIENPKENTTWYATSQIWSDTNTSRSFWISFNNLSRSYFSDSPNEGTWDNRGSSISVNAELILPPKWKRAGQKGHSEIPLSDEGYEYREPIEVNLKKGWNTVLVKLPVASFKGRDFNNPVKWMFTFSPVYSNFQKEE